MGPNGVVDDSTDAGGLSAMAQVIAKLSISLDSHRDELARQRAEREAARARVPAHVTFAQTGLFPSSGALLLDMGGPAVGRYWQVRRCVIGGANVASTVTGSAWLLVAPGSFGASVGSAGGASTGAAIVPDLSLTADYAQSLPNVGFYSEGQVDLQANERLYCYVTGGTAGAAYVASIRVQDAPVTHRLELIA